MAHEEVMEQVERKVRRLILNNSEHYLAEGLEKDYIAMVDSISNAILSIPEILIKDPDQSLPHIPERDADGLPIGSWLVSAGMFAQQDMLKPDENSSVWVKVLPKEEK